MKATAGERVCCLKRVSGTMILLIAVCLPSAALAQPEVSGPVEALIDSGYTLLDRGGFERAYELFEGLHRRYPGSPGVLLGMGRALMELPAGGERALRYLTLAAHLAPDDLVIRYYKARAHIGMARTEASRANARQAMRELDELIDALPMHTDAYYERGRLLLDVYGDYEGAAAEFRNQVDVYPSHMNARLALLELEMNTGSWDAAVAAAESIIARQPDRWEAYPYLAAAHWKAGRPDEAMRVFERSFTVLPEVERELYFDLRYVLSPAAGREFSSLDEGGRAAYWKNYWAVKDPDPKTTVNERLLEHFIRVTYARVEFGEHNWPWDSRGDVYVRYGEPDIRTGPGRSVAEELFEADWDFYSRKRDLYEELGLRRPIYRPLGPHDLGPTVMVGGGGTPEHWYYLDTGLDLSFDNPVMSGRYLVNDTEMYRQVHEAMERLIPVISPEERRIDSFDPLHSAVTFRGEGGMTALEYAVGLFPDDFGGFRSVTGEYVSVDSRMELYTPAWIPVADAVSEAEQVPTMPQVDVRGNPMFVHGARLEAAPGEYLISVLVMDSETGRRAATREELTLPDYSGDELMISDIMPAARITAIEPGRRGRFVRGDLEVIPLPGRNLGVDQPLYIYFEVYNLTKDSVGATQYTIEYSVAEAPPSHTPLLRLYQGLKDLAGIRGSRAVLSSEISSSGIRRDISSYLEIDMSGLPDGIYSLLVRITDMVSGRTASNGFTFRTLPPPPGA